MNIIFCTIVSSGFKLAEGQNLPKKSLFTWYGLKFWVEMKSYRFMKFSLVLIFNQIRQRVRSQSGENFPKRENFISGQSLTSLKYIYILIWFDLLGVACNLKQNSYHHFSICFLMLWYQFFFLAIFLYCSC